MSEASEASIHPHLPPRSAIFSVSQNICPNNSCRLLSNRPVQSCQKHSPAFPISSLPLPRCLALSFCLCFSFAHSHILHPSSASGVCLICVHCKVNIFGTASRSMLRLFCNRCMNGNQSSDPPIFLPFDNVARGPNQHLDLPGLPVYAPHSLTRSLAQAIPRKFLHISH